MLPPRQFFLMTYSADIAEADPGDVDSGHFCVSIDDEFGGEV